MPAATVNAQDRYSLSMSAVDFVRDTTGRTPVDPRLVGGQSTAVIVSVGQSKIGNHSQGSYSPSASVQHLFLDNGGVYPAVEPLLGATGPSAAFPASSTYVTRLAQKLIDAGRYARVILVPLAIGGSEILEWSAAGQYSRHCTVAANRLADHGLTPTFIIQDQGESDVTNGTSAANYTARQQSTVQVWRDAGVTAPFFIATVSWINAVTNSTITGAQAASLSNALGIYAGPNLDTLNNTNRYDGTHFNATGADAAATLWVSVLTAWLDSH